jgi:hypothetical protein
VARARRRFQCFSILSMRQFVKLSMNYQIINNLFALKRRRNVAPSHRRQALSVMLDFGPSACLAE